MVRFLPLVLGGLLSCAPAMAQNLSPETAFGARESVTGASLSPDGDRVAFIAPTKGEGNALYVVGVETGAAPVRLLVASGDPERITSCGWVSDRRLICRVYSVASYADDARAGSRLVAVNIDGSELKVIQSYWGSSGGSVLDWLPGQDGAVLMGRSYGSDGYGVDEIDTFTQKAKTVVNPISYAWRYVSDGLGTVRIMGVGDARATSFATGVTRYHYRPVGSRQWTLFTSYNELTEEGFFPSAVDPVTNVAYGFMKKDGRKALYTRALDSTLADTLIFSRPDVDVDGLIRLGRKGRIVGVSFATDRRQAVYFDPALTRLKAGLAKILPATPLIYFEGESADGQKLLIWAGSDTDPGRYYLFDRTTKQLRPLILSRPELAGYKLAPVKSIEVRASDGAMIPAYLTLPVGSDGKGLPTIVMPHGGPSARDEWGFDWLAQYYANRGYAVLQPNYRGSSGYGDAWFQNNGFQSWRIAIGDVVDSGRWLVSQGIADPKKLAIVGWSYGGYAALQSGVVAPDLYKAIVAIAPVTDLTEVKREIRWSYGTAAARTMVGSAQSIREGSPAQNAAAITAPVMLFHGELDLNVDVRASKQMAAKLTSAGKNPQMFLYPGLDHGLDDSAVRAEMLGKSDAFLRKAMGM